MKLGEKFQANSSLSLNSFDMDSSDAFVIVAAPVVDLVAGLEAVLVAEAVACTAVLEAAAC